MDVLASLANIVSILSLLLVTYKSVKALKTRIAVAVESIRLEANNPEQIAADAAQELQDKETSNAARIQHLLQFWTTFAAVQLAAPLEWSYLPYIRAAMLAAAAAPTSATHDWLELAFQWIAHPVFGKVVPGVMWHVGRVGGSFAAMASPALRWVFGAMMSEKMCEQIDVADLETHLEAVDGALFTTKMELRSRELQDAKRTAAHARFSSGELDDGAPLSGQGDRRSGVADREEGRAGQRGR